VERIPNLLLLGVVTAAAVIGCENKPSIANQ